MIYLQVVEGLAITASALQEICLIRPEDNL